MSVKTLRLALGCVTFGTTALLTYGLLRYGHDLRWRMWFVIPFWLLGAALFFRIPSFWIGSVAAGLGTACGALLWGMMNIGVVANRAEIAAGGRAYCIQVPDSSRRKYEPISRRSELNGLTLQGASGEPLFRYWAFHAVLAIDMGTGQVTLMNWSYRLDAFVPIQDQTRQSLREYPLEPVCLPRKNFIETLPLF